MAGLGLQWAAGNMGAQDAIEKIVAARKMDELLKQKQAQQEFENSIKSREVGSLESLRQAQAQPQQPKPYQMNPGDELFMPGQGVLHTVPIAAKEPTREPVVQVDEGGRPVYRPQSEAIGKPAFRAQPSGQDDIGRQLRDVQLQTAKDKQEAGQTANKTAQETRERQRSALAQQGRITLEELDKLLTPDKQSLTPAAQQITGLSRMLGRQIIPGTKAADADAVLKRVGSRRITDLMAEMKAQSRTGATGFGQLSERELDLLQSAAARLSTNQSEGALLDALLQVRQLMEKSVGEAEGGGAPRQGTVKRFNPATGQVE